jgi:hypothetical protein
MEFVLVKLNALEFRFIPGIGADELVVPDFACFIL